MIEGQAHALGLKPNGVEYCQSVVTSPPSRNPTSAGRNNLLVDFASVKMGHAVQLESLTLEAAHAQMMEITARCIGYWSQPKPMPVLCTCRDGQKRKLWLTFDFLVIVDGRLELHECKPEAECIKLSGDFPGRYRKGDDGRWFAPEIEAALVEYGITFRIVTERDVPPTLVRNHALLSEVAGKDYSTPTALQNLLRMFERVPDNEGVTLAVLLKASETHGFVKNDIYRAIAKRDVFVPLADMLLVDEKTTRVFAQELHSEVYRLVHFKNQPLKEATFVLRAGDRVIWNGTEHSICNASNDTIYLQSKEGTPIRFRPRYT